MYSPQATPLEHVSVTGKCQCSATPAHGRVRETTGRHDTPPITRFTDLYSIQVPRCPEPPSLGLRPSQHLTKSLQNEAIVSANLYLGFFPSVVANPPS